MIKQNCYCYFVIRQELEIKKMENRIFIGFYLSKNLCFRVRFPISSLFVYFGLVYQFAYEYVSL